MAETSGSTVLLQSVAPELFSLSQNFPNPFNPTTNLTVALPTTSRVSLAVYDMLGRKVAALLEGVRSAGYHSVTFDGTQLPSGMYIYKVTAAPLDGSQNPFVATRKMILAK